MSSLAGPATSDVAVTPGQSQATPAVPGIPLTQTGVAPVASQHVDAVMSDTSLKHYYSLLAEDVLVHNMSYHTQSSDAAPKLLLPKDLAASWEQAKAQLIMLGFKPDDPDPWCLLGIHKMEGPPPTNELIVGRARSGTQWAHLCQKPCATPPDVEEGRKFEARVQSAAQACLQSLHAVLRDRKKLQKSGCEWRWMEVDQDFVYFLAQSMGTRGWKSALHISNLLGADFSDTDNFVVDAKESMVMYRALHGNAATLSSALDTIKDERIIMWAPTNRDRANDLFGAILKRCVGDEFGIDIAFAVPYEPMPGCNSVEILQELWTHPLLSQKRFAPMVRSVQYFEQPMRCVFTGPVGPLSHMKSIALIQVGSGLGQSSQCVVSWKSTLLDKELGHIILVDVPMEVAGETQATLEKANLDG